MHTVYPFANHWFSLHTRLRDDLSENIVRPSYHSRWNLWALKKVFLWPVAMADIIHVSKLF